jgi:hypothetical protein
MCLDLTIGFWQLSLEFLIDRFYVVCFETLIVWISSKSASFFLVQKLAMQWIRMYDTIKNRMNVPKRIQVSVIPSESVVVVS